MKLDIYHYSLIGIVLGLLLYTLLVKKEAPTAEKARGRAGRQNIHEQLTELQWRARAVNDAYAKFRTAVAPDRNDPTIGPLDIALSQEWAALSSYILNARL